MHNLNLPEDIRQKHHDISANGTFYIHLLFRGKDMFAAINVRAESAPSSRSFRIPANENT